MNQAVLEKLCASLKTQGEIKCLFPKMGDRKAWNEIKQKRSIQTLIRNITDRADQILEEPIPTPRFSDAMRFRLDGNRADFEAPYFKRRCVLSMLVLACVLTGDKERYFSAIIDYLGAIAQELFWCVPAHSKYPEQNNDPFPLLKTGELTDLFASGTAVQLALTLHLLEDELTGFSPGFTEYIRQLILDRTIGPLLEKKYEPWWFGGFNNWTPWCSHNILTAGILLLDKKELSSLLRILWEPVTRFWNRYQDDGFCDEGAMYWGHAGGQLILFLHRLDTIMPGSVKDVVRQEKFFNIAMFPVKMHIEGDLFHVFADGISRPVFSPNEFLAAFRMTGREELRQAAVDLPGHSFENISNPTSSDEILLRMLDLFTLMPDLFEKVPAQKSPENVFFPDRLAILRKGSLTAVLKGGNNGESHNHNDLGHFAFYAEGKPVIIDLGSSRYTRQYFSEERYQFVATSAAGHNAPLFDGKGQEAGEKYQAKLRLTGQSDAEVELSRAYPDPFGICNLTRSIHLDETSLTVTDRLVRRKNGKVSMILYSPSETAAISDRELEIASFIRLKLKDLRIAGIEEQTVEDVNFHRSWGKKLWRIVLEAEANDWSMKFIKTGVPVE